MDSISKATSATAPPGPKPSLIAEKASSITEKTSSFSLTSASQFAPKLHGGSSRTLDPDHEGVFAHVALSAHGRGDHEGLLGLSVLLGLAPGGQALFDDDEVASMAKRLSHGGAHG